MQSTEVSRRNFCVLCTDISYKAHRSSAGKTPKSFFELGRPKKVKTSQSKTCFCFWQYENDCQKLGIPKKIVFGSASAEQTHFLKKDTRSRYDVSWRARARLNGQTAREVGPTRAYRDYDFYSIEGASRNKSLAPMSAGEPPTVERRGRTLQITFLLTGSFPSGRVMHRTHFLLINIAQNSNFLGVGLCTEPISYCYWYAPSVVVQHWKHCGSTLETLRMCLNTERSIQTHPQSGVFRHILAVYRGVGICSDMRHCSDWK